MNLNIICFMCLIAAYTNLFATEQSQKFCANTYQVEITDFNTLSCFDDAHLMECNSNGQALIYGRLKGEPYKWGFWNAEEMQFLPSSSDGLGNEWLRINRNGLVVGVHKRPGKSHNAFYHDIITWSLEQGYRLYQAEFENRSHVEKGELFARCRNSDWVVVNRMADRSEHNEVLLLENGELTNLTSILYQQAQLLGFDAGGWIVSDINSKGMLLGKFCHYEKNPSKDSKIEISTQYFMKDGESFYLINDLSSLGYWFAGSTQLWDGGSVYSSFDDEGCFLYSESRDAKSDALIWTPKEGLKRAPIPSEIEKVIQQEDILPPRLMQRLDDGTCVWQISYNSWALEQSYKGYIFEKDGNYSFMSTDSYDRLILDNIHQYPGLKFAEQSYVPLFQKTFGFIQVNVLGESHPCLFQIRQN
jgi:hypothetical protein